MSVIISGSLLASDIKADNLFQFFADKYFLETSFTQTTSKDFKDRQIRGKLNATRSGNFKIEYFEPMKEIISADDNFLYKFCLLYTSPSPRDKRQSRMPSSA